MLDLLPPLLGIAILPHVSNNETLSGGNSHFKSIHHEPNKPFCDTVTKSSFQPIIAAWDSDLPNKQRAMVGTPQSPSTQPHTDGLPPPPAPPAPPHHATLGLQSERQIDLNNWQVEKSGRHIRPLCRSVCPTRAGRKK